jgi:monomeric sarcosine oxidase
MRDTYEHIVIGAGVIGTATAYWLARSGATDVLVLEQFELGHGKGASEDHSRIIRHAYHNTTYTALTHAMFEHWSELEAETGLRLVDTSAGMLDLAVAGTAGEQELGNYRASLAPIDVGFDDLTAAEIRRRWPQWRIEDDTVGLFQPDGGILDIRKACAAQIARARARGVEFLPNTTVLDLEPAADRVTVTTDRGRLTAGNVVVCVASWIEKLMPALGLHWNVSLTQEQVSYFATPNVRDFTPDRFPVWAWHGDDNLYYGFPIHGEVAVKISRDVSGRFITSDERSSDPRSEETELFRAFLAERLPTAVGPELLSKTCVYDLPPDRDFILDRVPGHPRVTVGLGAAHAAKFGNLLGHILSDITLDGNTAFPIDAFRADRPALTDPTFVPRFRMVD